MTVAITLKVTDGVVLAADSATTLSVNGQQANVYNNANKVINLVKGLPIGVATWGLGSIGPASIATVLKDLRLELSGELLGSDTRYSMSDIATRLRDHVQARQDEAFEGYDGDVPELGFYVVGYSSGEPLAEEFEVNIRRGQTVEPARVRPQQEFGVSFAADIEALYRLVGGFDPRIAGHLKERLGLTDDEIVLVMQEWAQGVQAPYVQSAMPIQDAIDLARWMVELTAMHRRFTLGHPTVGGPVEVAAITKHEGFRWVQRKLYYHQDVNPEAT